jgi:hypothetical protein
VEDLMLSRGPVTARLFQIAYEHANKELGVGRSAELSRQEGLYVASSRSLLSGTPTVQGREHIRGGFSSTLRLGRARGLASSECHPPLSCRCRRAS